MSVELLCARRKDNAIHSQVDGDLAIVIPGVGNAKCREGSPGLEARLRRLDHFKCVGGGKSRNRLVGESERPSQRLDNVFLVRKLFDRGGVPLPWLSTAIRPPKQGKPPLRSKIPLIKVPLIQTELKFFGPFGFFAWPVQIRTLVLPTANRAARSPIAPVASAALAMVDSHVKEYAPKVSTVSDATI